MLLEYPDPVRVVCPNFMSNIVLFALFYNACPHKYVGVKVEVIHWCTVVLLH